MLILDFDGTCTDAEEEGKPFTQACLLDIAQQTELDIKRVREIARDTEVAMRERPQDFAWVMDGYKVAPASVDPYLRMKPIVAAMHKELGTDIQIVDPFKLYKDNYPKSGTHFREGLLEVMWKLMIMGAEVFIVTNSGTEAVKQKLRRLARELTDTDRRQADRFLHYWLPRVCGDAKKYIVSGIRHDDIPFADLSLPGLQRPVHVQRHEYYKVLDKLRKQVRARPNRVLVIGDIFELDLALPMAMGWNTCLLQTDLTPRYEVDHLQEHVRGHVITSISDALPLYKQIHGH